MNDLTPIQVRVLGCLMEKKETTPDQYPLTLNALRNACNQKTSRYPVVSYSEGEVGHTLRELEALDLVREEWGARVPKYQHLANKALNLHSQGIALLATLMLRGPQTLNELKINSHRLFDFDDLDDVQFALGHLIEREPSMVASLPRQPGQKEGRFAHLLSGEPDIPVPVRSSSSAVVSPGLEARVTELEAQLEHLQTRLKAIEDGMTGEEESFA
ncbi:MAG: YceH family protein [Xanthomonadales bacterium]|nr:YceH family protein [Xanthomonadales bacterium]